MKKNAIAAVVLAASIIMAVYLTCFRDNPQRYSQHLISEERYTDIIAARSREEGLLEELIFDEQTLLCDNTSRTFYYSLVEGSSSAYDPYVKIRGTEGNLRLAFSDGAITEEGIRDNRTISVLAYTDSGYEEYALKCTLLPIMNIECDREIGDAYVPMTMTLFDNRRDTASRVTVSEGEIHIRGASARDFPKKSYRISLKTVSLGGNIRTNQVSLLGMRQDDDWLLYAGFDEPERVRNVFSTNLWKYTCATNNARGIDTGTEYKYVEVFMNGSYLGLYALGYPVGQKLLGIDHADEDAGLYKKVSWADEQALRVTPDGVEGYEIKGGAAGWPLLEAYYYGLSLHSSDNESLYAGIDMDNAIDIRLFYNLIQGFDNVSGNSYRLNHLIKNQYLFVENGADGPTALYVPWDLDYSWGGWRWTTGVEENCIMESGYLNQLMVNGDTSIWERIFDRYEYLRRTGWSEENIDRMLDEYEAALYDSGAYLRESERWPETAKEDASEGLRAFREYVMNRLRETDLYYERMETLCGKSIFIRRSGQYKDFEEHTFVIELRDKELLKDRDYAELFAYMGIDTAAVTEDVTFIVAKPSAGIAEYLTVSGEAGTVAETGGGTLSFAVDAEKLYEEEGACTVYLDGVACYDTGVASAAGIQMAFLDNGSAGRFDFTRGYELSVPPETLRYLETVWDAYAPSTTAFSRRTASGNASTGTSQQESAR
ncbi:MAG: CotH kinase family protein [Roseburia sp.]|nr:CotH kinase family protein [Roseburia sp.]